MSRFFRTWEMRCLSGRDFGDIGGDVPGKGAQVAAPEFLAGVFDQFSDANGFKADGESAGFNVGEFDEAVDLGAHQVGLLVDDAKELERLGLVHGIRYRQKSRCGTLDSAQRGS